MSIKPFFSFQDQYFSIQQTISIVKQIASATQYLHECGYIHSNISSHAVLIREEPFSVKLSSFELATEILPREPIGQIYHPQRGIDSELNLMMTEPVEAVLAEKYYKLSKQHFYNRTSLPNFINAQDQDDSDSRLPYSVAYRRMFSMHYYQPPELLIPSYDGSLKYVLPSTRSDTFALALLLWEALNHCVPFVLFNHDELVLAYRQSDAKLPLIDKSSSAFLQIFDSCLRFNADERLSEVTELIQLLDEVFQAGDGKGKSINVPIIVEPSFSHHSLESKKNFKNAKLNEKVPEKIYFAGKNADPQRRGENAITAENLLKLGQRDNSKISDSIKSSELEAHIASFTNQPGILHDDALDRIRKTVEDQRVIAPKKPLRRREESEIFNASRRSLTDSTMYQSFFNFNTPKIDKDVIYERTSTLKKRSKASDEREQKKSVKGLFDQQKAATEMYDAFDKMNTELSQIVQDYGKNDFMEEIVQELNDRQKNGNDEAGLSTFLNLGMNQSRSFDELASGKTPDEPKLKRSESDNVGNTSAYRFAIGEYQLPKTPIARQNKIRRNAWLSDSKKPAGGRISDIAPKPNKSGSDIFSVNNSLGIGNKKQYNVNIKIHQNDLDSTPKQKSTNVSKNDSSINIKFVSPSNKAPSPLIKVNNIDLNGSRYNSDMNKKYYPMMPEMLSDVIQNKRDRSGSFQACPTEDTAWQPEEETEDNVIVPVRTSVRDAVKFIESTFKPNTPQATASPSRNRHSMPARDLFSTPVTRSNAEESQNDMFFTPATEFPKHDDDVSNCLMQASESIQRLNEIFQANPSQSTPMVVNKRVENITTQTPTKITTKVTVNLKKISRRASEVNLLKQEQSRHSICNNAELIKRIQMHFASKDQPLQVAKRNSISASCSNLVPKEKCSELGNSGKCSKYFCRNCGFTMLPAEVLQKIQSTGRLSIASSLAEGLQSVGRSQSITALRKCHTITVSC